MRRAVARAVQSSARIEAPVSGRFAPAPELAAWAFNTFVLDGAPLQNPEHRHLRNARVAFLWAPGGNSRGGQRILGTCQFGLGAIHDKWLKAQREEQIRDWFGDWWSRLEPQFLVTIETEYWNDPETTDANRCALVEHELLHAGQAKDEFGYPKFTRDGIPVFCSRPHDFEEFFGVIERYGAEAAHLQRLEQAIRKGPTIGAAGIARHCGTCLGRK